MQTDFRCENILFISKLKLQKFMYLHINQFILKS